MGHQIQKNWEQKVHQQLSYSIKINIELYAPYIILKLMSLDHVCSQGNVKVLNSGALGFLFADDLDLKPRYPSLNRLPRVKIWYSVIQCPYLCQEPLVRSGSIFLGGPFPIKLVIITTRQTFLSGSFWPYSTLIFLLKHNKNGVFLLLYHHFSNLKKDSVNCFFKTVF